jgi:hypothetical protein
MSTIGVWAQCSWILISYRREVRSGNILLAKNGQCCATIMCPGLGEPMIREEVDKPTSRQDLAT